MEELLNSLEFFETDLFFWHNALKTKYCTTAPESWEVYKGTLNIPYTLFKNCNKFKFAVFIFYLISVKNAKSFFFFT